MKNIPPDQQNSFQLLLEQESFSRQMQVEYQKWLRFYLDFCQKDNFVQSDQNSLDHFMKKLREKKQTDLQQSQAARAIKLYYKIIQRKEEKQDTENQREVLNVRTTMIYTHTIKSQTRKEAISPLDF